jgi:hypothetical protein
MAAKAASPGPAAAAAAQQAVLLLGPLLQFRPLLLGADLCVACVISDRFPIFACAILCNVPRAHVRCGEHVIGAGCTQTHTNTNTNIHTLVSNAPYLLAAACSLLALGMKASLELPGVECSGRGVKFPEPCLLLQGGRRLDAQSKARVGWISVNMRELGTGCLSCT